MHSHALHRPASWRLRRAAGARHRGHLGPYTRAVISAAVTWLPLMLTAATDRGRWSGFVADLPVHSRLLLSLPVLIAAERLIFKRLVVAAQVFERSGLVALEDRKRLRSRNLWLIKLRHPPTLLAPLLALSLLAGLFAAPAPTWRAAGFAAVWNELVAGTLFRFVLLRWVWWLVLWGAWTISTARLRLRLPLLHPDGRCGLGFLNDSLTSFSWVAFAVAMPVVVAAHAAGVAPGPRGFPAYFAALALVGVGVAVAVFAPLYAFAGPARAALRLGWLELSVLTAKQARAFRAAWLGRDVGEEVLTAPDFSALNDLQDSFLRARLGTWFPIKPRAVLTVVLGAFGAAIPLLLLDRELLEVARKVVDALR